MMFQFQKKVYYKTISPEVHILVGVKQHMQS